MGTEASIYFSQEVLGVRAVRRLDARLMDLFAGWSSSDEVILRILVTNPATVYAFPEGAS